MVRKKRAKKIHPKSYNVRLVKDENGCFVLDDRCFMLRCAKRGRNKEWVDASITDRERLIAQLFFGIEVL
jgi:hypothetical protein